MAGSVRDETRAAAPARDHSEHHATPAVGGDANGNVSSFEDADDNVAEKGGVAGLSKRQKVKRHCLRFKWWYLLALVIFLAILLPIM